MKTSALIAALAIALLTTGTVAHAGGKPAGAKCHVSKSCQSNLCIRLQPQDKFGVCCNPTSCAAEGAQCGEIQDGCGTTLNCQDCNFGDTCINNQCVGGPPTTTTSTTTTSTTTTSTTTTTTLPPPTTTTLGNTTTTSPPNTTTTFDGTTTTTAPPVLSCVGHCGGGAGTPDCYPFTCACFCDTLGCNADNCADVDTACPGTCTPP